MSEDGGRNRWRALRPRSCISHGVDGVYDNSRGPVPQDVADDVRQAGLGEHEEAGAAADPHAHAALKHLRAHDARTSFAQPGRVCDGVVEHTRVIAHTRARALEGQE